MWITEIKLFDIPILKFLFDTHLQQTIFFLSVLLGLVLSGTRKLHEFLFNRRVPISLKQKLHEATDIYITPDYGFSDPSHYLEPGEVTERTNNLICYLETSFNKPSTHSRYIILAESGMGKSALLFNIYHRYLRKLLRKCDMKLIELGFKNALCEIDKIENMENTILLLDGLDESADAIADLQITIKQISEKTQRFYKVILTCRTQFFNRVEEIPNILTNVGGVASAGEREKGTYEKLFLFPFTNAQIEEFLLHKYVFRIRGFSIINYFKSRKTFKKVPYISVRPMLLSYIEYLLKVRIDTRYSFVIYESMIYGWLKRRKSDELDPKFSDNLTFVYNIAILMARNFASNGGYFVSKEEANGLARQIGANLTDWQISGRSLLNISASAKYKFSHLSIMEVLLARADINEVDLGSWEKTALTKGFIVEMTMEKARRGEESVLSLRPQVTASIRDEFERLGFKPKDNRDFGGKRKDTQAKSRADRQVKDNSFVDFSGKLLQNGVFCDTSFRGSNFSKAKSTNCDFSNSDFTGANIVEGVFLDCDLSYSFFLGANITSAQFINCTLKGSNFSMVRISRNDDAPAGPIFRNSDMSDAVLPNNYVKYFREIVPCSEVKRDLENVELV